MKWLHVLPTLDPRAGGPIQGVRNLGTYLTGQGHGVEVVTVVCAKREHGMAGAEDLLPEVRERSGGGVGVDGDGLLGAELRREAEEEGKQR